MKRAVNLQGYATPAARLRRSQRANAPKNLLATMKFLGMSEKEQREFLEKAKVKK
mgnify:CR=1 FL=1